MELEHVVANLVQKVERRFYGKYRGYVVDNVDPEQLGRLKVSVPSVLGNEIAVWAFPCFPYGGDANQGMLFIPEIEAGVWVEFEEGDPEFPIWVGTFWSKPGGESELPKPNDPDGAEQDSVQDPPTRKIIKTTKGHTIQFEDADGDETVTIVEAVNGHVITMDKDGVKIIDGTNEHEAVMSKDGVKITHSDDIFIEMKKDAFNITSKAPFTISQGSAPGNSITLDDNGILFQDKNLNKIEMASAGVTIVGQSTVTIQDIAGVSGKIAVSASGVILGLGSGGPIACAGTNMVATMLGPQPIMPGVNLLNMA